MKMELSEAPRPQLTSRIGEIAGPDIFEMVRTLGAPIKCEGDDRKVEVEWCLALPSGKRFVIWNWKNGPEYLGHGRRTDEYRLSLEDISEWSCWWEDESARDALQQLFGDHFSPDR